MLDLKKNKVGAQRIVDFLDLDGALILIHTTMFKAVHHTVKHPKTLTLFEQGGKSVIKLHCMNTLNAYVPFESNRFEPTKHCM